jgi:hypothetical protein
MPFRNFIIESVSTDEMQHYKTKQTWCLLCRKHRIRSHSMAVVWKQQSWFGSIQCSWGRLLSFLDCREGKKSTPSVVCPLCITIPLLFVMSNTSNHCKKMTTWNNQNSILMHLLFHVGGTMVIHSNYGFPISFTIFFQWSEECRSHFQWMWLVLVHDPCCIPWALPTLRCDKHLSTDDLFISTENFLYLRFQSTCIELRNAPRRKTTETSGLTVHQWTGHEETQEERKNKWGAVWTKVTVTHMFRDLQQQHTQ